MQRIRSKNLIDELTLACSELFDQEEKWLSFLELASVQPDMMKIWYDRAYEAICKFTLPDNWGYYQQDRRIIWYIKKYDKEAVTIRMEKEIFFLYANPDRYDTHAIRHTLEQEQFEFLTKHLNMHVRDINYFGLPGEMGKYRFGSVNDDSFDGDALAWFAGNRTVEFVEQVRQKLLPFLSPEGTELITELNLMNRRPYIL